MKKISLPILWITITFSSLLLTSCKKETSDSDLTTRQEEEIAILSAQAETENEWVFNEAFDNVMGVNTEVGLGGIGVFGRLVSANGRETNLDSIPACMILTVTHLNAQAYFPVKIVLDFGGGCPGKDGHIRYGKMITTYSGRLTVPGNSATTIFDGFKIDSTSVEGIYTISNTTATGSPQRQFTADISNARLSKPGNAYSQWTSHRKITQLEGNSTPDFPLDDVFLVEGSAHGKARRNNDLYAWHSEIVEPLRKKLGCRWFSKGTFKTWKETLSSNSPWAAVLNYGDGTCDAQAQLTVNGLTKEVKLPR